jgi:uncharacterized SAM-binding protein YcdF (DUF218 family)
MLLVTDVFLLLTQVLLWILVGLAAKYILSEALPKAFLSSLVLILLVVVTGLSYWNGSPGGSLDSGVLGQIWQLISIIFNPLGMVLVLLCTFWWNIDNKKGKGATATTKWLLRVGITALLIMSLPLASNFLVQRSELEAIQITRPDTPALSAGSRRVIVLMGQGTTRLGLRPRALAPAQDQPRRGGGNGWFSPPEAIKEGNYNLLAAQAQLTDKGDRLVYAAQMYNAERGNAPLILVSAGQYEGRDRKGEDKRETASEAVDIKRILTQQFLVPAGDIVLDTNSSTVQDSAVNVRKLLEAQSIKYDNQLMIVTSALEASRTSLTFQNEFSANAAPLNITSRPTDFYMLPPKQSLESRLTGSDLIERTIRVGDFLPSTESLDMSSRLLSESLTSLYYFLRGWIRPIRAG